MPRRSCGSFGWRRVHDDTPAWIWSGLSTVVVWLRSFELSLLGRVSVFGRTCLYSSVVSYYTFYDGGLCAYGRLMIVILNMTIRVMNYVMCCRPSSLNEDDLQPRPLPRMDKDPPFPNTRTSRPRICQSREPDPMEGFFDCRILSSKTVGGTRVSGNGFGDDQPVTSRGEHWTRLAPN